MSLSTSSLGPITSLTGLPPRGIAPVGRKSESFGAVLEGAIQGVEKSRNDADQAVQKLLNGDGEELHSVALAAQRADLAFDLGLQVRNKIVSAYQEVMRMQI